MNVAPVETLGDPQIGGGSGWVSARIGDAVVDARTALTALQSDWGRKPVTGLHPREAAIAAAREAIVHLNEALSVEAPQDAIEETRHALEALSGAVGRLEKMANQRPVAPGELPIATFETAIDQLTQLERRLADSTSGYG
jgi:hypothetical protein